MAKLEELCFYYNSGNCTFLSSAIEKCNLCPNFISFKDDAKRYTNTESLPITYFDLIMKEKGSGFQKSLPISLE